jgi:hypothetical protein
MRGQRGHLQSKGTVAAKFFGRALVWMWTIRASILKRIDQPTARVYGPLK